MARLVPIRLALLCAFTAGATLAQTSEPGSLAALEGTARQKTADWERLAREMESSIARLLPCDSKAAAAITTAGQASEARMAAAAAYLQAADQQASRETAAAQLVLAAAQSLASELVTDKTDVTQEQAGIEGQLANLAESVKNRPVLGDAQKLLQQIQAMAGQRTAVAQGAVESQESFLAPMRDLVAAAESWQAALKEARAADETEHARWNAYYSARLARAQTECSITRPPASAARPRGKGKKK